MKENLVKRFLEYVMIDTTSDPKSNNIPSSDNQWDLANYLKKEMESLGLKEIELNKEAVLTGYLPANTDSKTPSIGFIAHMDTSPDASGKNVDPIIYEDYDGEDIELNKEEGIIMKVQDFPELKNYIGHDLITTDGTTLLGADDKAGIAEIITAIEHLINHPEIKHGRIAIAFTPDEEIGGGAKDLDIDKFNCDFAYTIDGGALGQLQYENFNACQVKIDISGRGIHPGRAKNKMINAIIVATELLFFLPANERPETTEGYEGFYHVLELSGNVTEAHIEIIIRDHDMELFIKKKEWIKNIISLLNRKYNNNIKYNIEDTYYNMREKIMPHPEIIDLVSNAMKELGIEPIIVPVRGGTDGAQLSYRGLPCPNIFTGGMNYHGIYEYISINDMLKATELIIKIAEMGANL